MTEIKNNANPLVSIIVPVFNVEKYIKESLESILSQTYSNLEVIIIDDCSTDSTYEICSKYADKNEKIKLYQTKSNKGTPSSPKNLGLKKATGEFILFVDGDDFIDISMIEILVSMAIKNDCPIVMCGAFFFNDQTGEKINCTPFRKGIFSTEKVWVDIVSTPITWGFTNWAKLFNRKIIIDKKDIVLFNENLILGEDRDWLSRVLIRTNYVFCINMPLYHYRRNISSISSSYGNIVTLMHKRLSFAEANECVINIIMQYYCNFPDLIEKIFSLSFREIINSKVLIYSYGGYKKYKGFCCSIYAFLYYLRNNAYRLNKKLWLLDKAVSLTFNIHFPQVLIRQIAIRYSRKKANNLTF